VNPTWQRVAVFGIAVTGIVMVAVTKSAELGVAVAAINALLPSVFAGGSKS